MVLALWLCADTIFVFSEAREKHRKQLEAQWRDGSGGHLFVTFTSLVSLNVSARPLGGLMPDGGLVRSRTMPSRMGSPPAPSGMVAWPGHSGQQCPAGGATAGGGKSEGSGEKAPQVPHRTKTNLI